VPFDLATNLTTKMTASESASLSGVHEEGLFVVIRETLSSGLNSMRAHIKGTHIVRDMNSRTSKFRQTNRKNK
jgi:hypothetical protein